MKREAFYRIAAILLLLTMLLVFSCGGERDNDDPPSDDDDDDSVDDGDDDDDDDDDDSAHTELTISYHRIPSAAAPPNPITGQGAPEEYNKAVFLRYHLTENGQPLPVRAVIIMVGGFMGGANNFHYMASELVTESDGALEVWAMDRRPNMLEDLTGLQAAEREQNPSIVYDYYVDGKEVDGRTFEGFLPDSEVSYLTEWSIGTVAQDLAALIDLVPRQHQKTSVFLAGHSLGGFMIENFAAWDFDDDPATLDDAGFNRIGGLILLDGSATNFSEITFLWDLVEFVTGLADFNYEIALWFTRRVGYRYFWLPPMQKLMPEIEAWGMAADWAPDQMSIAFERSKTVDLAMWLLYKRAKNLQATNAGLLGMALDNDFQWISAMASGIGDVVGPVQQRRPLLAVFEADKTKPYYAPDGPGPYGWKDIYQIENPGPDDVTDIHTLAEVIYTGPTNWIEWYFNTRVVLDVIFTNDMDVKPNNGDVRWREGLRSIHVGECDMPVIAFGAEQGFLNKEEMIDKYRGMLPPVRNSNGAPRQELGFDYYMLPGYAHHDIMLADNDTHPNRVFGRLLDWVDRWGDEDTFTVELIEQWEE